MKPGRPPIPPEMFQKFIDLLKAGNYIETACAVVGVSKSSVYNKLREGNKKASPDAILFLDAVKKALAESESRDVVLIGKAAEKNWTAAAWRLERKYERWRRKDNLALTHSGGMAVISHQATPEEMEFFKANFAVLFPDLKGKVIDEQDGMPEANDDEPIDDKLGQW